MQDNAATIDVTEQNVQQLLEHSRQVPVLFGFWASWSQPSQQMTVMLEKLTQEYQGKFLLAKVNADEQAVAADRERFPRCKESDQSKALRYASGRATTARTLSKRRRW